jgi:hypothetical protein
MNLTEAPLADITTHGDPLDQEGGSFNRMDRRFIQAAIINKFYHEKLKKLPFELYVYVINKEELLRFAQSSFENGYEIMAGTVEWGRPPMLYAERRWHEMPELSLIFPTVQKNLNGTNVHLILGNNYAAGGGDVPMTPWMIVHRLMHCVDPESEVLNPHFWSKSIITYKTSKKISWWDVVMMKSVRDEDPNFDNEMELALEMAVEYYYTGNIRVNVEKITAKCQELGKSAKYILREVDRVLTAYKAQLDQLAARMKGKTFYI